MNVALCAIARSDKEDHPDLTGMLESAKKVGFTHLVLGVDDRSHPNTVEWVKERWPDADVFLFPMEADGDPHFANARNLTLERIPKECEWWGWADSDDVIESVSGKTVPELLDTLRPDVGALVFNYHYANDEFGNAKGHLKTRLFKSSIPWEWRDRVHEDCHPADGRRLGLDILVVKDGDEQEFRWVHHSENKVVDPGRNLRCLKRMLRDDPTYPRAWFYLGNQHFAAHNWRLAAEAYERYVPLSAWTEEKWWALIYSAIAYRALGEYDKALERDDEALTLLPKYADAYFGIGESYCRKGEWQRAIEWGELGIQRVASGEGIPSTLIWFNANSYQFQPYTWLAVCYFNVGDNDKALAAYEQAYKARPEPELKKTIDHLKWAMDRTRIIRNGIDLAAGLMRRNEPLKGLEVLANLPAGTSDDPNVRKMAQHIAGKISHLHDRTSYQNFYFGQEETNDPLISDEVIERDLPRMAWALRRLQKMGAKKVLDIGVGNGVFDFYLARHGIRVVGIDVDVKRVKGANWNAVKAGYQGKKVLSFDADEVDDEVPESIELPDAKPDSMAQFLYCPPGEITPQVRDLGPYDAVVAMEVIEHVPDVEQTLAMCESMSKTVLLSTPDGMFDGPQVFNGGHVRAYSQRDLTRLLIERGRIVEIHPVRWAPAACANIVAEYRVGEKTEGAPVTIWCPDTGQGWSPDSLLTGIGGSETAVIRVSEELAKRGKRVTVYAECEGVWDGVRYAYSQDFVPQPCELFVSWRSLGPVVQMKDRALRRFIWAHDVHFGPATKEQLEGVTILALSEWHKSFLSERYEADIVVTGNGIDPERFDKEIERVPHRLIYASSPDRGLDRVLALFPEIKRKYPDATLEVFYGFDAARKKYPDFIADIETPREGVTIHGRVGQDRLAEEYLKADAMIYPSVSPDGQPFMETYCISAVEALAGGVFCVTADHGALREKHGPAFCRLDTFDNDALFQLFAFWDRRHMAQQNIRDHGYADDWDPRMDLSGRRWALAQTWGAVADQWLAL